MDKGSLRTGSAGGKGTQETQFGGGSASIDSLTLYTRSNVKLTPQGIDRLTTNRRECVDVKIGPLRFVLSTCTRKMAIPGATSDIVQRNLEDKD